MDFIHVENINCLPSQHRHNSKEVLVNVTWPKLQPIGSLDMTRQPMGGEENDMPRLTSQVGSRLGGDSPCNVVRCSAGDKWQVIKEQQHGETLPATSSSSGDCSLEVSALSSAFSPRSDRPFSSLLPPLVVRQLGIPTSPAILDSCPRPIHSFVGHRAERTKN